MLQLKNIRKTYHVGEIDTIALNDISVSFRKKEFVAILGTSGSGKTTCLNIIGGLDRYDSGDLIIKGKSTKEFKDKDWDAYRNNSVGFVFQSYNLIMHLSIVANVELGMTLSGVSSEEKHKRAVEVLEKVGLKDHLHKKPNQLSGGQMQRVAIARALANDPEILLCDEPTGALDTTTSVQIMDLIQELAKERLVIMVTHNPELANQYADRIIRFQDGSILSDTNPYQPESKKDEFELKKTSMRFLTALKLSFHNIRTKKGRTFLTAFASSIGIIGIAVILSLSTGFQTQIDEFQSDAMAEFPIFISQVASEVDSENIESMHSDMKDRFWGSTEYVESEEVFLYDSSETTMIHQNKLTDEFLNYLEEINPEICSSIGYTRIVSMNLIRNTKQGVIPVTLPSMTENSQSSNMTSTSGLGLSSYPDPLDSKNPSYLEKNYDLLAGAYPETPTDLVLVIDSKNRLDITLMENLGFDTKDVDSIKFDDIIGTEFKIVSNNDYYTQTEYGNFIPSSDFEAMYNSKEGIDVKITGIVRVKEGVSMSMLATGIAYSDTLTEMVVDMAKDSDIVKAQKEQDINVMTMKEMDAETKQNLLLYLGSEYTPYMLMLYPQSFESKDEVIAYIEAYNQTKDNKEDIIIYNDLAGTLSNMTKGIMDGITIVLIAFAGISLVVSMIMICIITYTSVLERTKEIGILKALGARKKDITRVFDAETFILGIISGILGILIAWLLTFPINQVIYKLTELEGVSNLQPLHGLILIVISTVLTVVGGHIPAKMASKKDAVEALRSE